MIGREGASPKVSIMIPTFNQGDYIADAVRSALQQSYENLEVIVGDDASTDHTPDVVASFRDPRLRYVRHPRNLGRVANYRTLLYEFVTGEYAVNLDGDDYYTDEDFLSEAVALLARSDTAPLLVVARASTGDGADRAVSEIPPWPALNGLQVLEQLPRPEYAVMHMAALYRVEEARRCEFYRTPVLSSDWESLYRLAAQGTIAYLDREVGVWRQHGGNETAAVDVQQALDNLSIWRPIYDSARSQGMRGTLARFKTHQCEAHFALEFLVQLSRRGNKALLELLGRFARAYPLGFLFLVANPRSVKRLLQSLAVADRA